MIDQNNQFNQLPNELNSVFFDLEIHKHLRQARAKDAVYRFLNQSTFNFLSTFTIRKVARLTNRTKLKVFIIGDSFYDRSHS